jgi:hypothetical protein
MSGAGQQRKPLPSRLDMVNLCLASSLQVHTFYCEGSRVFHPKTNCKFELLRRRAAACVPTNAGTHIVAT